MCLRSRSSSVPKHIKASSFFLGVLLEHSVTPTYPLHRIPQLLFPVGHTWKTRGRNKDLACWRESHNMSSLLRPLFLPELSPEERWGLEAGLPQGSPAGLMHGEGTQSLL